MAAVRICHVGDPVPVWCTDRPLGNLQRVRKEAYRQSSILRHEMNHQARKEPKSFAEVFGS